MANKQKKTQKEMYNELLALPNLTEEQKEFLQGRIAQLEKKGANKKETEKQKDNQRIAQAIYDYMENGKKYTITDLIKEVPALQELETVSNQYVTSLVKSLKDNELVERIIDKGRAKFVKVETETEGEGE